MVTVPPSRYLPFARQTTQPGKRARFTDIYQQRSAPALPTIDTRTIDAPVLRIILAGL